ncbi:SAVED domain-containing protein [Melittangium boletus]|uniref:CHAT domain-containing protein n=1 Tax=Melittangium boletus DSM 14713 TaxID=1294270 RepID=A0A250IMH3_9BACT|nr:SAVED domain-containing protein [Melittangium boletus]ATB32453.1 CHAT domain-containing protein [Melittangium boletus DSM 14713]
MNTIHAVLCLDVDASVADDDILPLLPPARRELKFLRLSTFTTQGPKGKRPTSSPVDWIALANAVSQLASEARSLRDSSSSPVEFFIVGLAPLPLFVLLGAELSAWAKPQTFLNVRKDTTWDVLRLDDKLPDGVRYFDTVSGLSDVPSEANGLVGIFISTQAMLPRDAVRDFLRAQGNGIAGVVECRNSTSTPVDAAHAPAIAEELVRVLAATRRAYPNHSGLALFVSGPASLAFMAGRAFNPRAMGSAWVASYAPPGYELAFTLPWKPALRVVELRRGPKQEQARQKVLLAVLAGARKLKDTLQLGDLPPFLAPSAGEMLLTRLHQLTIADEPEGDETRLSVGQRRLTFGRGLLEGMRQLDERYREPLALQYLLHELFHFDQELTSQNYRGVGRGGFALEEVDYWADILAIGTLTSWRMREGGPQLQREPGRVLAEELDVSLRGIETFDRMEHGERIGDLLERRLRRYLIWALHHARAKTLRHDTGIWKVLGERLIVELAPLRGRFDTVHDKVIIEALPDTELFVVWGRRLMRLHRRPGFEPAALVDIVRTFDQSLLLKMMEYVAEKEHAVLTPWV